MMKFFVFLYCLISLIARASMASTQSVGTLNLVAVVPEMASVQVAAAVAQDSSIQASFRIVSNAPVGQISIQAISAIEDSELFFRLSDCKLAFSQGLVIGSQPALLNTTTVRGFTQSEFCNLRFYENSREQLVSTSRLLKRNHRIILEIRAI